MSDQKFDSKTMRDIIQFAYGALNKKEKDNYSYSEVVSMVKDYVKEHTKNDFKKD